MSSKLVAIQGPLFIPYLERIHQTMEQAIHRQASTMAVRIDLYLPDNGYVRSGDWFGLFIRSLKEQVDVDLSRREREGRWVPDWKLDYTAVEEKVGDQQVHYHACLFLNGEIYRGLGEFPVGSGFDPDVLGDPRAERADSLAKKIVMAWARALGMTMREAAGLVHFPTGGVYRLRRSSPGFEATEAGLFNRLSYLAKAQSKRFGRGGRNIRYSRGD